MHRLLTLLDEYGPRLLVRLTLRLREDKSCPFTLVGDVHFRVESAEIQLTIAN